MFFGTESKEKKTAKELGITEEEVRAAINYSDSFAMIPASSVKEAVEQLQKAQTAMDTKNINLALLKIDELVDRELISINAIQSAVAFYQLLPAKSKKLGTAIAKCLSLVTNSEEAAEIVALTDPKSPERSLAILKQISLAKDYDEAKDVFQETEANTPEEIASMEKCLTFVTDTSQAEEMSDMTAEGSEAEKMAYKKFYSLISDINEAETAYNLAPKEFELEALTKWLSLVSDLDEAKNVFDSVAEELEEPAFEKWLSLAETIDEVNDIFDSVNDEFEKMADEKLKKLVLDKAQTAGNFAELEAVYQEIPSSHIDLCRIVLLNLISSAADKDQMQTVYDLATNDSDLWDDLEEKIIIKWLSLINTIEDAGELLDKTSSERLEKMIESKMNELLVTEIETADSFEKAEEIFNNINGTEESEKLVLKQMIFLALDIEQMERVYKLVEDNNYEKELQGAAFEKCLSLANSINDLETVHDNFSLSKEENEAVLKKWISLVGNKEDMTKVPFAELDKNNSVYQEAVIKLDQFYLQALSSASSIAEIEEVVDNAPEGGLTKKAGLEKWLPLVSNASEAEDFLLSTKGEEMEVLAVKKLLSFLTTIREIKRIYDNYQLSPEAKELVQEKWNQLALNVRIYSLKEARETFKDFPPNGDARREFIKQVYNLS